MIFLVSLAVSIFAAIVFLSLITYIRKRTSIDIFHRMRRHNVSDEKLNPNAKKSFLERVHELIQQISKPLDDRKIFSKLDLKLKQAGIQTSGAEFTIIIFIAMLAAGLLAYMLTIDNLVALTIGVSLPMIICFLIQVRIRKRKNSFTEQLGDCLITIANALRAGYSFQQAMDVIAKEMESPIGQEFSRASTDIRMGMPVENALLQMDKRIGSTDFSLVITAVLIQREVGGNLAQILDTISDTIMERIRMKREINALTAQGRLSAIILVLLPIGMGFFTYTVNPEKMQLLFTEPTGQMAIAASIVMDIIGFLIIRRIVDIEI